MTVESLAQPIKMTNISKLIFADAARMRPPPIGCSNDVLWHYYSEYIKASNELGANFNIDDDIHVFRNRLLAEHLLVNGELKAKYSEGTTIAVDHNFGGVVYASMDADEVMKNVNLDSAPPLIICLGEPIRQSAKRSNTIPYHLNPNVRARSMVVEHPNTPNGLPRSSITLLFDPGCSISWLPERPKGAPFAKK
jgi:hypothetical protein